MTCFLCHQRFQGVTLELRIWITQAQSNFNYGRFFWDEEVDGKVVVATDLLLRKILLEEIVCPATKLLHERVGSSVTSTWTRNFEEANNLVRYFLGELQKSFDFAHCSTLD